MLQSSPVGRLIASPKLMLYKFILNDNSCRVLHIQLCTGATHAAYAGLRFQTNGYVVYGYDSSTIRVWAPSDSKGRKWIVFILNRALIVIG